MDRNFRFERKEISRITTGSLTLDNLLGGGLPVSAITDVYGAAGTGKTQFAFQNAVTTCAKMLSDEHNKPLTVFIDCSGAFRPERIAEISDTRGLQTKQILDRISEIAVRTVSDQDRASQRVLHDTVFSHCRLLIIDDVTVNFTSEYTKGEELAQRQIALSVYMRRLSYICAMRGISVLLTNSVRSRGETGEGETTGEILSEFSLIRFHFRKVDQERFAELEQPGHKSESVKFTIGKSGVI